MSGRVAWISHCPVKGLALRQLEECQLTEAGVAGDRQFFLVDENDRLVNSKGLGILQQIVPRYDEQAESAHAAFPDGTTLSTTSASTERSTRNFGAHPFTSASSKDRGAKRSPTSPAVTSGSSGLPGRPRIACAAARPLSSAPARCARSRASSASRASTAVASG